MLAAFCSTSLADSLCTGIPYPKHAENDAELRRVRFGRSLVLLVVVTTIGYMSTAVPAYILRSVLDDFSSKENME